MDSVSNRGILADVSRVFTGKYMNPKWCLARGKAENLNGALTAYPAVTNRTNNGSEWPSE